MDKKNIIYLVILIVLVAVFVLVKTTGKERETFIPIIGVDSTQIAKIRMYDQSDTLVLERHQGTWMIEQPMVFPAGQSKLHDLFDRVIGGTISSIPLAENESSHDAYNVTPEKGSVLELYGEGGNLLEAIVVGKSENPSYCNVRRMSDPTVYQFNENVTYRISPKLATWRKKEILEFVPETIERIDVKYSRNAYSITATDTAWVYHDSNNDFSVQPTNKQLLKIFNVLEKGRSGRFIDDDWETFEAFFNDPALDVTVTLKTGETTRFQIADAKDEDTTELVMKLNDDTSTLYHMTADFVERFTKSPEHFQPEQNETP